MTDPRTRAIETIVAASGLPRDLLGRVWEFDVGVSTHDLLRMGVTVAQWRRVSVWAVTEGEASLVACQMAAHDGAMPTECLARW